MANRKSIASRRKYVPPSIKEKLQTKDIAGEIKQHVIIKHSSISTGNQSSTATTVNTQPSRIIVTNSGNCTVGISIEVSGSTAYFAAFKVRIPEGTTIVFDGDDVPINAATKGIVMTTQNDSGGGSGAADIVIVF